MTFPTAAELAQNPNFVRDVKQAEEFGIDLKWHTAYIDMFNHFRHMHEMDFSHRTMLEAAELVAA